MWLEFAVTSGYCPRDPARDLYQTYNEIIAMLVSMINRPENWLITTNIVREENIVREDREPYITNTTPFDSEV